MKKIFTLILLTLLHLQLYANYDMPDEIPTPNAASLGTYGIIPVSLYTGKPNISIPLYTFEYRGLSLPISLDYDASGVKVNELPGWVGMNWSLKAGGVITRSVRGYVDERHNVIVNLPGPDQYENYDNHRGLGGDYDVSKYETVAENFFEAYRILACSNDKYANLESIADHASYYDTSADVYFFNFMGYSGYFYFNHEGQWKVQSESNLDVIFKVDEDSNYIAPFIPKFRNGADMDKSIKGFTIRDDKGFLYEFGNNADAIEYSTPFYDMGQWDAMSWYLTKITDKYGNVLYTFEYERGKYIVQVHNYNQSISYSNSNHYGNSLFYDLKLKYSHSDGGNLIKLSFHFNSPVYLKKIRAGNGMIAEFESCDNEDKDEKGEDYMAFNRLYYRLYNLFHDDVGKACYRSHLRQYAYHEYDSYNFFRMKDSEFSYLSPMYYKETKQEDLMEKVLYNKYKRRNDQFNNFFDTDEEDIFSKTRVRKLSKIFFTHEDENEKGIGYRLKYKYNGRMHLDKIFINTIGTAKVSNGDYSKLGSYQFKYDHFGEIPEDPLVESDAWGYYNNGDSCAEISNTGYREPNPYYAKLGSLVEIQYPTGGTTEFEYEINQYGSYLNENKTNVIQCENNFGSGLRIASITNWDSPSHTKMLSKKTYTYTMPNSDRSSGIIFALPIFIWKNWKGSLVTENGTSIFSIKRNCSILPLVNSFGPNLGYSCVKETNIDGSYTVNWYSNMSNPDLRDERYYQEYQKAGCATPFDENYTDKSFMRGKLLLSTSYDSNNRKIKSTGYKYRPIEELKDKYEIMSDLSLKWSSMHTYIFPSYHLNKVESFTDQYILPTGGLYKVYYSPYDLMQVNDTIFEGNGDFITRTNYMKSDEILQVTTPYAHKSDIRLLKSKEITNSEQSYKEDYAYTNLHESPLYQKYFNLIPNQVDTYVNDVLIKSHRTVWGYENDWKNYVPRKEQEKTGTNGFVDKVIYGAYGPKGNLTEYSLQGVTTKLVWDEWNNHVTEVIKGNLITGYAYDNVFGLQAICMPNGTGRRYEYDQIGRLICESTKGQKICSYEYNYRNQTADTLVSQDTFQRVKADCSVAVGSMFSEHDQTKNFEIAHFQQSVTFHVRMFTNEQYATGVVVISSSNNEINYVFNLGKSNKDIDLTFTKQLNPGNYSIHAKIENSVGMQGNRSFATISATYEEVK